MRIPFLLLIGAIPAISQPISFGAKAGVPLTDFLSTVESPNFGFNSTTNRYIIGPTVELHLPFGFGVEFDALYRHLNYAGTTNLVDAINQINTSSGVWEFPLLAKYRFRGKLVRPFVSAGVAWDTLSGLSQTITTTVFPSNTHSTTTTSQPAELNHSTTTGFVTGAGLDVHVLLVHISPEVRYTRWGAQHFLSPNGGLSSNQNQAEFLLGITF
jgi:opacity protein-like surface antigen